MTHVTRHPLAVADEPMFVVHVEDTISAALAGHDGVEYRSPPLPREEALALVRVLLGDGRPAAETQLAVPDRRRAAHRHARARAGHRRERKRPPTSERSPAINTSMHLIATTDEHGLHADREQLERTGIEPGTPRARRDPPLHRGGLDRRRAHIRNRRGDARPLGACPTHAEP